MKCLMNAESLTIKIAIICACLIFVYSLSVALPAVADDGYRLWLRYEPINDLAMLDSYREKLSSLHVAGNSPTLQAARQEIIQAIEAMFQNDLPITAEPQAGTLILGTPQSSPFIRSLDWNGALEEIGQEGYIIRSVKVGKGQGIAIAGNSDEALLYGAFRFLREVQMHRSLSELDIKESPRFNYRVLDHWDNINGTITRGYSGESIWEWADLPEAVSERYADYARACASIGINVSILNNVNASEQMLTSEYIKKEAAIADVLRPYGIRVGLSARFSAPMDLDGFDTSNPKDPKVQKWWEDKAAEIYREIPDFAGFLVKADSEGKPGPHDYGATHADGANLLADAVKPYGGIVMWRAFGVFDNDPPGYPGEARKNLGLTARPTDLFLRIDGMFRPNVFVQAKNGPRDFQPREAPHPLLGGMKKTPMMAEVQITQEYYGHSTHLVYLAPTWKEVLDFDTKVKEQGSTISRILDGTVYGNTKMTGIAGVANVGSDRNWTGHLFAQANWYAFGRLAWDPDLSSRDIAEEWVRMTFSHDIQVVETIGNMMMGSREAAVNYMTPLGLFQLNDNRRFHNQDSHYAPNPSSRTGQHNADQEGIGGSWLIQGTLEQYSSEVREIFGDPERCPEKHLLWFHKVNWDHKMSSGRTLWEELCYRYVSGVEYVKEMQKQWQTLKGKIDKEQWKHVNKKLAEQIVDAGIWRDECLMYFSSISGRPIPPEIIAPIANSN